MKPTTKTALQGSANNPIPSVLTDSIIALRQLEINIMAYCSQYDNDSFKDGIEEDCNNLSDTLCDCVVHISAMAEQELMKNLYFEPIKKGGCNE